MSSTQTGPTDVERITAPEPPPAVVETRCALKETP